MPVISRCQQECINTVGSFGCGCIPGYVLNNDNATCTDASGLCARANLNCTNGCLNDTKGVQCYCKTGSIWSDSVKDCVDENECDNATLNGCDHKELCKNLPGSYNCSCRVGYKLGNDGRTCTLDPTATTQATQPTGATAQATATATTQATATTSPAVTGRRRIRRFRVRFKIIHGVSFHAELKIKTSSRYKSLFTMMRIWIVLVYRLVSVKTVVISMDFSQGSVAVDAVASLNTTDSLTVKYLEDLLTNETASTNSTQNFTVSIDSVALTEIPETTAAAPDALVVGLVTGLVLAFVLIVLVALLAMYAYQKRQTAYDMDDRRSSISDVSEPSRMPHMRNLHWQPMGPYPHGHQFDNYAYEQQRIRNITRAMNQAPKVDWSVLGQFANNKSSQLQFRGGNPYHRGEPPYSQSSGKSDPIYSWKLADSNGPRH